MKVLNAVQVVALLVTGGAVLGAEYLGARWMYNLAAVGFGLVVIAGGLRVMITGQARGAAVGMDRWHRDTEFTERHAGVRARLIGALMLLAGPLVIAVSVIEVTTPGGMDAFWAQALRSPRSWGLVSGLAGLTMTLAGALRAKAGTGAAAGSRSAVVEAEFKAKGLLTAAAGLALLAVAAVLLISPGFLENALAQL